MNEEFNFENNAKESFKFFINEDGNLSLNVRNNNEIIASFIIEKEESEELRNYLNWVS